MPPKLLACIGFLHKVLHKIGRLRKFNRTREIEFYIFIAWTIFIKLRLSPKVQSHSGDWILHFYRLDYLYQTWHTCSPCLWLQKSASDFLIFAWGLCYVLSKSKRRCKIVNKPWKTIPKGSSQKFEHCGQTKELSYGTLPPPSSSNESVIDNGNMYAKWL